MSQRIAVFVGTRPEAIKMAPVIRALEHTHGLEPVVVSTGQHREMLQQVVDLFGLPVHHTCGEEEIGAREGRICSRDREEFIFQCSADRGAFDEPYPV